MKKIALIGSTGSIGTQVLSVVRNNPEKFKIVSLSANENGSLLARQVEEFSPLIATLNNGDMEKINGVQYYFGKDAHLNAVIDDADIVVVAVVGFSGLTAVIKAIELKKDIALANKESLVVGGELVMSLAKQRGVKITPIDSEHSAVWQALDFDFDKPFKRIILTASGGAFRDYSAKKLKKATVKDALKHPNWSMGKKITIDCATLCNKGFEVIEAKWLFNADFSKIDAVIHRESIIHSMVEFDDNSVIAEMSYPTMEIPIALALDNTIRLPSPVSALDFSTLKTLSFDTIDNERFPCFNLIVDAGEKGGLYPTVANACNEIAVSAFIENKIKFSDIYSLIDAGVSAYTNGVDYSLDGILEVDKWARDFSLDMLKKFQK